MKNSYIRIQINGKNVNNYLKWIVRKKIEIKNVKIINQNQLELTTKKNYYDLLNNYSKTYQLKTIKKYGALKIFECVKENKFIIISITFALCFLHFLSNLIFEIEIVYNDKTIQEQMTEELKKYDIEKYKLKKSYNYLNKVKEEILNNNKETLEWIEIIENGTKYIVKIVERKKQTNIEEHQYQSIVASKDAIIANIKASSGEKIKDINEYVKKDEVIVSGNLIKPNGEIIYKKAQAKIYGEVWYKISVEYPLAYYEENLTGKSKNVFIINFLNWKIPLFTYSKYKEFKIKTNNIVENQILPLSLSKEKQYEVNIKEEIYTWEESISNAIEFSKKKLIESNQKILEIKKVQILNNSISGSKVKVSLFISVIEDITKIVEIKPEENNFDLQN